MRRYKQRRKSNYLHTDIYFLNFIQKIQERLFNEHVDNLANKNKQLFHRLLDETPQFTLTSSYKEIKKFIKDDPRFSKFSSSDRVKFNNFCNQGSVDMLNLFVNRKENENLIHICMTNLRKLSKN